MSEQTLEQTVADQFPQLSFEISDQHVENTIFITTDPAYNQIVFSITTNQDGTTFTPGQLVPPDKAPSGQGSTLYLDLSSLNLSHDELGKIRASADNWSFQTYPDAMVIGMTPTSQISLNSGPSNTVDIQITGLTISKPPSGSNVQMVATYYQVSPVTRGDLGIPTTFKVLLQVPPDTHDADLHQEINWTVDTTYIIASLEGVAVKNSFMLTLAPGPDGKTVEAGPHTAFVLTFSYGTDPGYGALTDTRTAHSITVTADLNAGEWHIVRGKEQQNPSWALRPRSGKPIIGSGVQSNVAFQVGNIVSYFRPGPTTLFVAYTGVPGYPDGSFAITLNKIPHVAIGSLTISPNPTYLQNGSAQVTVSWQTENATALRLDPLENPDVTGKTSVQATIRETTHFTLQALGQQVHNVAFKTTTAVVLPRINEFTASPLKIYARNFPHDVTFSWALDWNGRVKLQGKDSSGDEYSAVGTVTKMIHQPQMMTLLPVVAGASKAEETVSRNLILSAFEIQRSDYQLEQAPHAVAASPTAPITALAYQNHVAFHENILYQPIGNAIQTDASPCIAFAPDGSFLFVASGQGKLQMITVQETSTPPYYSFSPVALPSPSQAGQPVAVAIGPKGTNLFALLKDEQNGGSLVILKRSGHTYFIDATLPLGKGPGGLALDPSGARVYVSNTADGTVSVLTRDTSETYAPALTLQNLGSDPGYLTVTPDGKILLVGSPGSHAVFALDTAYPDSSPRKKLPIQQPGPMAAMPGGSYVFVCQQGGSAVSLIACGQTYAECEVVEQNIAVGSDPCDVTVTGDDGIAFVAKQGERPLSALTLATYDGKTPEPVAVGRVPTSVTASPDSQQVFIWHNALIQLQGKTPDTGIYVYDRHSLRATRYLQRVDVVACVFDPVRKRRAYMIVKGANELRLLDTKTFERQGDPSHLFEGHGVTCSPTLLALSANGKRLFVVAEKEQLTYHALIFDLSGEQPKKIQELRLGTVSGRGFMEMCVVPNGSQAFVVVSIDSCMYAIEKKEDQYQVKKVPISFSARPHALAIQPDGSTIYILGATNERQAITIVDPKTYACRDVNIGFARPAVWLTEIVASPDGKSLFVTDLAQSAIRVIDPHSLRFSQTIVLPHRQPWGLCVLADGSEIYVADRQNNQLAIARRIEPSPEDERKRRKNDE